MNCKRIVSIVLTLLVFASTVMVSSLPVAAKKAVNSDVVFGDFTAVRFYGSTRYETSMSIAEATRKAYESSRHFDNIIIASGTNYPDALTGSFLAIMKNAPILLVNTIGASLNENIKNYVAEMLDEAGTIYILGGNEAVSKSCENTFKGICSGQQKVVRLAGESRFETNLKILDAAVDENYPYEDLLVCNGRRYADALSTSAVGKPMLLVDRSTNELTKEQISYLSKHEFKNIYIVGGTAAVSNSLEKEIKSICKDSTFTRLAGETRYETSVAVANEFFDKPDYTFIATGENFPDGICGGPLAYLFNAPIVVTTPALSSPATSYLKTNKVERIGVLGGQNSLSDATVKKVFKTESILDKNYTFSPTGNFKSATTPASLVALINSAPLNPMKTNDEELDKIVDNLFAKLFTPGMSQYDKLLAAYKYLVPNFRYGALLSNKPNLHSYVSSSDAKIVYCAKNFLIGKQGICYDYSSAFTVLARRIGFQCYYVGGSYGNTYNGHAWTVIVINGQDYLFDPEAEFRYWEKSGYISTYLFCRTYGFEKYNTNYYPDRVNAFNGFITK